MDINRFIILQNLFKRLIEALIKLNPDISKGDKKLTFQLEIGTLTMQFDDSNGYLRIIKFLYASNNASNKKENDFLIFFDTVISGGLNIYHPLYLKFFYPNNDYELTSTGGMIEEIIKYCNDNS